jgi:hypothetical protein
MYNKKEASSTKIDDVIKHSLQMEVFYLSLEVIGFFNW